jgi:hypothetical protein
MSARRRRPERRDDTELLRALRNLGTDYEPDVTAIERRVRHLDPTGDNQVELPDRLRPVPGTTPRPTPRFARPVLLPAAAVVLLVGGIVVVTSGNDPAPAAGPTASGPVAGALTTPTPTTSPPAPERSSTETAPGPLRTTDTTATRSADPTTAKRPTRPAEPAGDRVQVSVQPLDRDTTGSPVDLTRPALTDWLAVGTRQDGKQVRAKAPANDPVLTVDQPDSATSTTGPFAVSWNDGLPEQNHDAATRWLKVNGTTGPEVIVAAADRPRTVVLHAGLQDLQGTLTVNGKTLAPKRTSLHSGSTAARPLVLTVALPPTTAVTRIQVTGTVAGSSPAVYLAAVSITRTRP